MSLSQKYLREVFDYTDGALVWKHNATKDKRWNTQHAGQVAGYRNPATGYLDVCMVIDGKPRHLLAHRLIFCMHYGYYPTQVDHINGDRADDRIENLRPAERYQNAANHKPYCTNSTGVPGVRLHRDGRYEARVSFKRRRYQVGSFKTLEEARTAIESAAKQIRGQWQREAA